MQKKTTAQDNRGALILDAFFIILFYFEIVRCLSISVFHRASVVGGRGNGGPELAETAAILIPLRLPVSIHKEKANEAGLPSTGGNFLIR